PTAVSSFSSLAYSVPPNYLLAGTLTEIRKVTATPAAGRVIEIQNSSGISILLGGKYERSRFAVVPDSGCLWNLRSYRARQQFRFQVEGQDPHHYRLPDEGRR